MTMAWAFIITPVSPSVHTSVHPTLRHPLSKLNSFDQDFMKLGHIVKYHNFSLSLRMVRYTSCLQELLPFVY